MKASRHVSKPAQASCNNGDWKVSAMEKIGPFPNRCTYLILFQQRLWVHSIFRPFLLCAVSLWMQSIVLLHVQAALNKKFSRTERDPALCYCETKNWLLTIAKNFTTKVPTTIFMERKFILMRYRIFSISDWQRSVQVIPNICNAHDQPVHILKSARISLF